MKDLPCWLSNDDKEVANALLELGWIWLKDEEPDCWKDESWEYKISRCLRWQFWATPGDTCLLVVRDSAVLGYSFEGKSNPPNFKQELNKAKAAIRRVSKVQEKAQKLRNSQQLSLFEVSDGFR